MDLEMLFKNFCVPAQSGETDLYSPSTSSSLPYEPASDQKMFVAILAKNCGMSKRLREQNFQSQMETYLSEKGISSIFINVNNMTFGKDLELPRILARHVTSYPMFMYMDVAVWNDMVSGSDWSSKINIMNCGKYDNVSNSFKRPYGSYEYTISYLGVTKWIESFGKEDDNPFNMDDYIQNIQNILSTVQDPDLSIDDKYKKVLDLTNEGYSNMPEGVKAKIQPYIRYNYIVLNRILLYKKIDGRMREMLSLLVKFCEDKVDKTKSFDDSLINVDIVTLSRFINQEDIEKEDKREVIQSLLEDYKGVLPEEVCSIPETYKNLVRVLF